MVDYTFASALLSTRSALFLTKNQFRDLKATDEQGFVLKLQSLGYGVGNKTASVDEILSLEVIKLKEELSTILNDDNLLLFFFSKYDLTNIRSFYKKKLFKTPVGPFESVGLLSEKVLDQAILKDNYFGIVAPYDQLFTKMSEQTFKTFEGLANYLQSTFQELLYQELIQRKDEALLTYFVLSTDINNLISLLRAKRLKLNAQQLRDGLLDHGSIDANDVAILLDSDSKVIVERYSNLYLSRFVKPLAQYFEDGDLSALERNLLKVLLDELKPMQIDITSSASIIAFVIAKQIEIVDLKRLYLDRESALMVEA